MDEPVGGAAGDDAIAVGERVLRNGGSKNAWSMASCWRVRGAGE